MRWVEGDTVILSQDHHIAHEQVEKALKTRFPNAMRWLIGGREPGVIHGDQLRSVMDKKEEVEEFDGTVMPDASDAIEIRALIRFLRENWTSAGRVHYFGFEEWETVFHALRYCAEEIGYLPKSPKLEKLRENSVKLAGKLLTYRYYRPSSLNWSVDPGDVTFYEDDWIAILRACQFAVANLNPDNPKMAEVKQKLEDMTPRLLERITKHEQHKYRSYGWKEVHIHRQINEIEEVPWNFKAETDKLRRRYQELRRLQGDTDIPTDEGMTSLLFTIRPGAVVKIFDRLGKYKTTEIVPEDATYRDYDVDYNFSSETLIVGHRGIRDRMVVSMEDVTIRESNVSYSNLSQQPDYLDYIYANYEVKKYKRKKD
jgi:hypothetical protein